MGDAKDPGDLYLMIESWSKKNVKRCPSCSGEVYEGNICPYCKKAMSYWIPEICKTPPRPYDLVNY